MKHRAFLFLGFLGFLGCQKVERDERAAPAADFEKMVIIQDQETSKTIGSESDQELKMR